ncbi:hypothetical protein GCM10010472_36730 [Pseudonocardia halophobica]|uniref:DUF2231 domain-containing protein n=1 Tax=Pseudonocardia halophobica TaxID=29401 RepID=A0A9W6P154_9PSEU|nr:DUF2231 domain-containing protein [Pseudonocardia halophobica]GLL15898.1 hypothetical protein GCM10017577_70520 [Pseudonocardia halophobica]
MSGSPIVRALRATENVRVGEDGVAAVQRGLRRFLAGSRLDAALRGAWLGHPVHPLLVTVPIGAWASAALLDAAGGQEDAARRVVGAGMVSLLPTVVTGLADWSGLDERRRRVGVLHAAGNVVSAAFLGASYLARRQGRHRTGAMLSLAGALPLSVAGALGGHLSYAQGAGVGRWPEASSDAGRTEGPGEPGPLDTGAIPGSGPEANPT